METVNRIRFAALLAAFFFTQVTNAKMWLVRPADDLQKVFDQADSNDTLRLSAGTWRANPASYRDPFCGNCLDASSGAQATRGFVVSKNLVLQGTSIDSTILITNAGYGLFIAPEELSSQPLKVELSNLRVTGGTRDLDGNATDAAIVVRNSDVTIRKCSISGNTSRADSVVVGIAGIVGREEAVLAIEDCNIRDNSWDGIALYRGARARVVDVTIEQGRGAGIGITWDAKAVIIRTTVTGYWKGIGTFGNAEAEVLNSSIHDNLGWGLIASGNSKLIAVNNAIMRNGNCGVAQWSDSSYAEIINNLIIGNGWRKEWVCPCVGYWQGGIGRTHLCNNLFWQNAAGETQGLKFDIFNTRRMQEYDYFSVSGNLCDHPGDIDSLGYPIHSETWEHRAAGVKTKWDVSVTESYGIGPAFGVHSRHKKPE